MYLENLRDLEVSREKLKRYHSDYLSTNDAKIQSIKQQTSFQREEMFERELPLAVWNKPSKPVFLLGWGRKICFGWCVFVVLFCSFLAVLISLTGERESFLKAVMILAGVFYSIYPIIEIAGFIDKTIDYQSDLGRTKAENEQKNQKISQENSEIRRRNEERAARNEQIRKNNQLLQEKMNIAIGKLLDQRQNHIAWYNAELEKLNRLIADFYNMNILPDSPYRTWRGLGPVCYIYSVLSTGEEFSLRDVLFSQQYEAGVQRLESKMDVMIGQLSSLVYESRCIKENTARLIRQNEEMLEESARNMRTLIEQNEKSVHSVEELEASMKRNEKYTLEAAQYASLSANYAKANAYFSLAEYLK